MDGGMKEGVQREDEEGGSVQRKDVGSRAAGPFEGGPDFQTNAKQGGNVTKANHPRTANENARNFCSLAFIRTRSRYLTGDWDAGTS